MSQHKTTIAERSRTRWSWAFLSPAIVLLLVFSYFPLLQAAWLSFHRWNLLNPPRFVGVREYQELFTSQDFASSLWVTTVFTVLNMVGTYVLALGAALLLQRATPWTKLVRTVALFPAVTPMIIGGIVWRFIFEPSSGILNIALGALGIAGPNWLFDPNTALAAVVWVTIWRDFGIYMLVLLGGLLTVPTEVNEAAAIDGTTRLQRLWYVTLPCIKQANIFVAILLLFNSLKTYDQIWVMTEGGPGLATTTILTLVFKYIHASDIGSAAAASITLFVLVLAVALIRGTVAKKSGGVA